MNNFICIFFLRIYRRKKGDQTTMNAASAPADPLHGVHRNRGMWSFRTDKVNIPIKCFSLLLGDKIISSWKKLGLKRSTHHWFWDSMVLHHLLSSSRWCWMLMMVVLCFCLFFRESFFILGRITIQLQIWNLLRWICYTFLLLFFLFTMSEIQKHLNKFTI